MLIKLVVKIIIWRKRDPMLLIVIFETMVYELQVDRFKGIFKGPLKSGQTRQNILYGSFL